MEQSITPNVEGGSWVDRERTMHTGKFVSTNASVQVLINLWNGSDPSIHLLKYPRESFLNRILFYKNMLLNNVFLRYEVA